MGKPILVWDLISKKIGVGFAIGKPLSSTSKEKYGNTSRIDIQGSIYGSKIGGDGFVQIYKGYYNANPQDFVDWNESYFPQLPEMKVLSIGVSAFYLFNWKKYSYRAAFVRDEIQKKSAGSLLVGLFSNYDVARTNNGFIPSEFPYSLRVKIDLKEFNTLATGISIGYAHNFVFKENLTIGLALIPGFGFQRIHLTELNNDTAIEDQAAAQILARMAIAYELKKFYLGITGSVNFRNLDFNPYDFRLSTEQFRVIIGKRFL